MKDSREKIIEHQSRGTLFVRVIAGDRHGRTEQTIASIPGVVRDARRAGLNKIVLDVTGVDDAAAYALLPTIVLTCRKAQRAGITIRVLAARHPPASAPVAGLTEALSISGV